MANGKGKKRVGIREMAVTFGVIAGIVGGALYYATAPQLPKHPLVGRPAPPLPFVSPDGRSGNVASEKGKVVLLNFWAGWCKPCLEEMPSLKMLETHLRREPFVLLAFDIDAPGENIRGTIDMQGMPSQLIFNFSKEALGAYGLNAIPISILIDRAGIVRHVYSGAQNWMELGKLQMIEELLK